MSQKPVNVVLAPYISRSGSTFLCNQLSAHPQICVCPEAEALIEYIVLATAQELAAREELIEALTRSAGDDHKLRHWRLDIAALRPALRQAPGALDMLRVVLQAYRDRTKPAARTILFKGPQALFGAFEIQTAFADGARPLLLGIMRDGRACFASQKRAIRPRTGTAMQVSPVQMARLWAGYHDRLSRLRSATIPPSICLIRYERLISEPAATLGQVLRFIGVDPEALDSASAGHDLLDRIPADQRHLHKLVGADADTSRVDSWRGELTAVEISLFEEIASAQLQANDYPLIEPSVSPLRRMLARVIYFARLRLHRWRSGTTRRRSTRLERHTL